MGTASSAVAGPGHTPHSLGANRPQRKAGLPPASTRLISAFTDPISFSHGVPAK